MFINIPASKYFARRFTSELNKAIFQARKLAHNTWFEFITNHMLLLREHYNKFNLIKKCLLEILRALEAAKWLITSPTSFFEKWWSFISSTSKEIDAKKTFSFSQLRSGVDVIYFYAFSFADGRRIFRFLFRWQTYSSISTVVDLWKAFVERFSSTVKTTSWSLKQLLIYCLHLEVFVEICCAI